MVEEQVFQYDKQYSRFKDYTEDIIKRYDLLKSQLDDKLTEQRRQLSH